MPAMEKRRFPLTLARQSPLRLVAVLGLSIAVAEAMVMLLLHYLPVCPFIPEALLDSVILIVFMLPILYFLMFRPLLDQLKMRIMAECELRKNQDHLEEMVKDRTKALSTANEALEKEIVERRQAEELLKEREKQVRHLSSQLLTAQEIERKRISMELHDELGQALNLIKLRISVIENGLECNAEIKEECEELLDYMDQVIEDVRRISLELSPTVLEDLGLTSALKWLVRGFNRNHSLSVTSDIGEINHLIPESKWIVIYRVIQEALTNIVKHAHAKSVFVSAGLHEGNVDFSVEDDGRGFDPEQAAMKAASAKGFGLTTMHERVRMLGGSFDLWSQEGKGTRITFGISVETGGT